MWTVTTNHESLRSDLITKFLQFKPEEIQVRVTIFTAFSAKSRNSIGKSLRVSSKTFFSENIYGLLLQVARNALVMHYEILWNDSI